jgi:hypothetical protein
MVLIAPSPVKSKSHHLTVSVAAIRSGLADV